MRHPSTLTLHRLRYGELDEPESAALRGLGAGLLPQQPPMLTLQQAAITGPELLYPELLDPDRRVRAHRGHLEQLVVACFCFCSAKLRSGFVLEFRAISLSSSCR